MHFRISGEPNTRGDWKHMSTKTYSSLRLLFDPCMWIMHYWSATKRKKKKKKANTVHLLPLALGRTQSMTILIVYLRSSFSFKWQVVSRKQKQQRGWPGRTLAKMASKLTTSGNWPMKWMENDVLNIQIYRVFSSQRFSQSLLMALLYPIVMLNMVLSSQWLFPLYYIHMNNRLTHMVT